MRLHSIYPRQEGDVIQLRPEEVAEVRQRANAEVDEDLLFAVCFVCSEAIPISRAPGTGLTIAHLTLTPGPLCQALLDQIGLPHDPAVAFLTHAILGSRWIRGSALRPQLGHPEP